MLGSLKRDMMNCLQTKGVSVLDHGISVDEFYRDLKNHIEKGESLQYDWKLPDWIYEDVVWDNQSDKVHDYLVYHDCGKPYCRIVDSEGKVHFPNHSEVSARVWYASVNDQEVASLIGGDMDIHVLKHAGVEEFSRRPECLTLLVAGLCEIHSNANMFGGMDSISFKMKWKQINKRGKSIIKELLCQNQ